MTFSSGTLSHLGLLRFKGPDSVAFLQGQISNDARRLAAGRPVVAALATNQGRVLAILHLLPHSGGIVAALPRELLPGTLERLRKFVLRAKVVIDDAGADVTGAGLAVAGQHGDGALRAAELAVPDESRDYVETAGIGVSRVAADPGRFWVVGETAQLAARGLAGAPTPPERIAHDWRLADVRAGLAQIYAATSEQFVPQMLNLDLIDAISFTKGCYTGQEIVARTQHLGKIKRRLVHVAMRSEALQIGAPLQLADGRGGRLIEVVSTDGGAEGLAVVGVEAGDGAADRGAADATLLTLPYAVP